MKRTNETGWTAGPLETQCGMLAFNRDKAKARALPSVLMVLAPITKGERGDSVSAKDGGDFRPWVYALAAIRWKREIPVYAMICRAAFVRELHERGEAEKEILLCDENKFDQFIGDLLVSKIRDHGSDELAAINGLLARVEKKTRTVTPDERDFLRAVEAATVAAADIPTKKAVREIWLTGRSARTVEQFRRAMETTGFGWLPSSQGR